MKKSYLSLSKKVFWIGASFWTGDSGPSCGDSRSDKADCKRDRDSDWGEGEDEGSLLEAISSARYAFSNDDRVMIHDLCSLSAADGDDEGRDREESVNSRAEVCKDIAVA